MSMITATAWVPRGYAAQFPTKYEFDQEEFDRIAKLAKLQLEEAQDDLEEAEKEKDGGASLSNGASARAGADTQSHEYDPRRTRCESILTVSVIWTMT
jgi:periodic tryptophan protein 1